MSDDIGNSDEGIALVGMAARFPGAPDIDAFWRNLVEGVDSISHFADDELEPSHYESEAVRSQANYVRARGLVEDADKFDAGFFRYTPHDAASIDPQQRVFMEVAWAALENAGCNPATYDGSIGVWAGMDPSTYLWENILPNSSLVAQSGIFPVVLNNDKDYLATRLSYKLDLRGPSITVQTACSTGLVVVHNAFHGLLSYQCDVAIAGVSSISVPQKRGYIYQEGAIGSRDGRCRPFDAEASGTVFSDGVGVVVMKRLADAVADGDTIYAVIKGSALNNDGARKAGFSAPSVDGQAEAIMMAQAFAGISPDSISYVEAHGTATPLGDPIEIAALTKAFRAGTDRSGFCAIGSCKGNIGHLDSAAGIAGLIKAALALHHKKIPASLHYRVPNPQIDFAKSPFVVNTELRDWQRGSSPRRAGVSSFGIGGTNAHAVLEEAPAARATAASRQDQIIVVSAKSADALARSADQLATYLRAHPELPLHDIAHTLQEGRQAFAHRLAVVARTSAEAAEALQDRSSARTITGISHGSDTRVAFMFPGMGSQYLGMAEDLYRSEPVFRSQFDACAEAFIPHIGVDIRCLVYPDVRDQAAKDALAQTMNTQPVIFAIELALARLLMSWGIQPNGMIGHSIGEYTAACLSGVLSLDELGLIAERARFIQQQPHGAMMAVRLDAEDLLPMLGPDISIAAYNAPRLTVVSGTEAAVARIESALFANGTWCKRVESCHAFHSPMMDGAIAPLAQALSQAKFGEPTLRWISCLTGDWITGQQAKSVDYWAQQMRQAVRFSDGVQRLLRNEGQLLLEVGPGGALTTLVRQHREFNANQRVLLTIGNIAGREVRSIHESVAQLWVKGVSIDWRALRRNEPRRRVPLPTYPFARTRHWIERVQSGIALPSPIQQIQVDAPADDLRARVFATLSNLSGIPVPELPTTTPFLELGIDSLLLTQLAGAIGREFGVEVTLPQLLYDYGTPEGLARGITEKAAARGPRKPVALKPNGPSIEARATGAVRSVEPPSKPIYLGPASRKIFSVFHPAQGTANDTFTLICPPLFSDYMRTHFALRQLAVRLAASGHNVLRMEYRGTGDSSGELEQVSPSEWVEDIALSLREGLGLAGSSTVRVLAVRAGALLAAKALSQEPKVERFVFWDPVADGPTLLADWRRTQATMLTRAVLSKADRMVAQHEFAGYRLSGTMVQQLQALSGDTYEPLSHDRIFVVESAGARCAELEAREWFAVNHDCDWTTESEDRLLHPPLLELLSKCLTMQ